MAESRISTSPPLETRILYLPTPRLDEFTFSRPGDFLDNWTLPLSLGTELCKNLLAAAEALMYSSIPVAFPTETVYGLGANAASSKAVRGIYAAKQRPSDNPLIVHVSSLSMLRSLLAPNPNGSDPIPAIYLPLIHRYWPGPLTLLLPNPPHSKLAPEVTAGLPTFAARMPSSRIALALIQTCALPLAAPSANASTKPSPTTAQHVLHDLKGRIKIILDGGPCDVGVESTVVDGLSDPPCILRPGGISIEEIRKVQGWESCVVGYRDRSVGDLAEECQPRAPGMKYRHYAPKARVVLVDRGAGDIAMVEELMARRAEAGVRSFGVLRTKSWKIPTGGQQIDSVEGNDVVPKASQDQINSAPPNKDGPLTLRKACPTTRNESPPSAQCLLAKHGDVEYNIWDVSIGPTVADVARGLFSGLRELDAKEVEVIYVEGIDEAGEAAAAVMNRLKKAAEERVGNTKS